MSERPAVKVPANAQDLNELKTQKHHPPHTRNVFYLYYLVFDVDFPVLRSIKCKPLKKSKSKGTYAKKACRGEQGQFNTQ